MQQNPSIPVTPSGSNEPQIVTGDNQGKKRRALLGILPAIAILPAALIAALFMTMFVFQSYEVDGPSMETTLQNQDRLLVWKLPRTWARITRHDYVPARGEIVIFANDALIDANGDKKQIIKRVIGVPGDRVVVRDGRIKIYNNSHPEGFDPDVNQTFSAHIAKNTRSDQLIDLVVGPSEIFVCGDNRPDSYDSRAFGTVKSDELVGQLAFRILPLNKFQKFL